ITCQSYRATRTASSTSAASATPTGPTATAPSNPRPLPSAPPTRPAPLAPAPDGSIDFDEPVALLFLSILHFVADEADPAGIIAKLLAPFPAGSHIAISHATPDEIPEVNDVERAFDEATTPAHVRSRAAIRDLIAGMDIIAPGLAWPPEWRP